MADPNAVTGRSTQRGRRALFISYRAADGKKDAARLAEDLRTIFGAPQVFFDKHDLQGGSSWREQIGQALGQQPVVLLVISELFFGATNEQGRRIEQADDPVRMEIADSMRAGARLLPLLCEGVRMPRSADLPADLRGVPEAHAMKLRTEDWRADLLKLADRLVAMGIEPLDDDWREHYSTPPGTSRPRRLRQSMLLGAVLLALGGGGAYWVHTDQQQRAAAAVEAKRLRALQHVSDGLAADHGKDVNLELARRKYLAALEELPDYGPAHYYLAQVYATQSLRDDALGHYRTALEHPNGLDRGQLVDARSRLTALESSAAEPEAVGMAPLIVASATPVPAPAPVALAPPPVAAGVAPSAIDPQPAGAAPRPMPAPAVTALPRPPMTATQPAADAVALVHRVAPPPERQRQAQAQAEALFADDPAARLAAASTLGVEPGLAADVLPLALNQALAAAQRQASRDNERAGLIATWRLIGAASPLTLLAERAAIEALFQATGPLDVTVKLQGGVIGAMTRLKAASMRRPRVYIQIGSEAQRTFAAQLSSRLERAGYLVPGIANIGSKAPKQTDLRVQGASNPGLARWMNKVIAETTSTPVALRLLQRAQPAIDTYEIWLGQDLCVAVDQQPPECQAR
jgi:tetratricopeptide (TPR) repeat protein